MRTITFYSYKGGTGRSLLLANLALLAAKLGQKVVALDFDLEAPGLSYKFFPAARPRAEGVVGWLRDALAGETPVDLDDYLVDVSVTAPFVDGGWLKLMPAGRAPSLNYFQDLRRLHLDQYLDEGKALDVLVELQERLEAQLGADLVMVDARTGVTSTNAVTTHVLADDVVVLALDRPEQLEGTRAVLRSLKPLTSLRTGEPLGVHVVLSRVAPRPPDAGRYQLTEPERATVAGVLAFLAEPTQPLSRTLDVQHLHLLHSDLALAQEEFLSFEGAGERTRTVLHVDYWLVARALLGPGAEDVAATVLEEAEPTQLEELAHYFASPAFVTRALGMRTEETAHIDDPAAKDLGLEDQVDVLRQRATADPTVRPDLARLLFRVTEQWAELGRRQEAVGPAEEAVGLYRALAAEDPAQFLPHFAASLNKLSYRVGEVGRRLEGLAAVEEAVDAYRQLAAADPAAYEPNLTMSLNNLSVHLSEVGRREEALAAAEEAVDAYRQLAAADPAAYEPNLTMSLNNLSVHLSEVGRREEALAAAEEAVDVLRRLAAADPTAYEPGVAISLNNLSVRLTEAGRRAEGLAAAEEAVAVRRRLAAANPAAYEPDLATSLNNLSVCLGEVGRGDEGLAAVEEAVGAYRRLAAANPAAYEPDVAGSLNNLSVRLGEVGLREEGLAAVEEAVSVYRRLAAANPTAYEPDLAMSLSNLSSRLGKVGRSEEGLAAIEEAVAVRRRLAAANPAAYEPDLATSLNNLSNRLGEVGRHDEGLAAIQEALNVGRRLAKDNPDRFLPDLATSLNNLADRLTDAGREEEAQRARAEAEDITRQLLRSRDEGEA